MKQAIVVIHGIGEQRPLATIRHFVAAITNQPAGNKPDRMSESEVAGCNSRATICGSVVGEGLGTVTNTDPGLPVKV